MCGLLIHVREEREEDFFICKQITINKNENKKTPIIIKQMNAKNIYVTG